SLGLSREASKTEADIIVFCGVDFMAETAKVLSPEKKVLIPTKEAKCPMAAMITAEELKKEKEKYPEAAVVSYVNTLAEIKAESDYCCTSANAVKVISSIPEKEIIFVPDKNLALYVQSKLPEKKIIPWNGYCYVHDKIDAVLLEKAMKEHPEAKVVVHPECRPEVIKLAHAVHSTEGMVKYVKETDAREFIIGTESGMINRLKIVAPEKVFYAAPPGATCLQMKKNSLELTLRALEEERIEVVLPKEIMDKARKPIERMISLS
ncbi:quinolinate synthase NadA, partial [Candidatus Micrarchaeota archaeon]|nr:quinolinate synthase NadA [Candidatus Micrarchaeota archaeon]